MIPTPLTMISGVLLLLVFALAGWRVRRHWSRMDDPPDQSASIRSRQEGDRMGRRIRWAVALVLGAALLGFGFIYFGIYDVAAARPHTSPTHWMLRAMTARSVAARADRVREGEIPDLSDTILVRRGSVHFEDTCATCHGAPGVDRSEMAEGLNPEPPALHEELPWTDREMFWIVKNGMKFTGMPAFGPTHSEEDLWSMVAFMRRLPEMSPEEYAAMTEAPVDDGRAADTHDDTDGHTHDD